MASPWEVITALGSAVGAIAASAAALAAKRATKQTATLVEHEHERREEERRDRMNALARSREATVLVTARRKTESVSSELCVLTVRNTGPAVARDVVVELLPARPGGRPAYLTHGHVSEPTTLYPQEARELDFGTGTGNVDADFVCRVAWTDDDGPRQRNESMYIPSP